MAIDVGPSALKIAFLGLSNAGKTSLIKSLTHEFDMLTTLKPTVNVERSTIQFLGLDLVFWDFGGQEHYRENYLNHPERYFNDISHVFYVVDIQDSLVLVPNVSYFTGLYKAVRQYSPQAKFVMLFHKQDPGFKIAKEGMDIRQKFLDAVSPLFDEDKIPVYFYNTTIYRLMTIITAVSQPLFENKLIAQNVTNIMKNFAETYNLLFATFFTEKYFTIGEYLMPAFVKKIPETKKGDFVKAFFEKNTDADTNSQLITMGKMSITVVRSDFTLQLASRKLTFFLIAGFDEESLLEKDGLEVAITKLGENLQKIFMNVDLLEITNAIDGIIR